jgi:hypothetical protein
MMILGLASKSGTREIKVMDFLLAYPIKGEN